MRYNLSCWQQQNTHQHNQTPRSFRRRGYPVYAALLGMLLAGNMASAQAQTRFLWPTASVNLDKYLTVEECLAATFRVRDSIQLMTTVVVDTMLPSAAEVTTPLPAPAKSVAQQCGAKFDATTYSIQNNWERLLLLYLNAGQPEHAWTLLQRRLAVIPKDSILQRDFVIDSAVNAYISTQPALLQIADSLQSDNPRIPETLPEYMTRAIYTFRLMQIARRSGDTLIAQRAAARMRTIWDKRGTTLGGDRQLEGLVADWTLEATKVESRKAVLDSLQRNTAAFLKLWKKNVSGLSAGSIEKSIGGKAVPIKGDFWFEPGASTMNSDTSQPQSHAVRPTPGRISLVLFVSHLCEHRPGTPAQYSWRGFDCFASYAALRRIAKQYPELEVTIVAQTYGYFHLLEMPVPRQEADSLRAWWLGYHRLPGTLAVVNTKWWRLDAPDRRRVNEADPNFVAYGFGESRSGGIPNIMEGKARLIDEDGVIVYAGLLGSASPSKRTTEQEFTELIGALFARKRDRAQTSSAQ